MGRVGIGYEARHEEQRVSVGGYGLELRREDLNDNWHEGRGQGRRLATEGVVFGDARKHTSFVATINHICPI